MNKITILLVILAFFGMIAVFFDGAYASGGILWYHQISLEKTVYQNGETVTITILGEGDRSVYIEVSDTTNEKTVVFKEQKHLEDETAKFGFNPDYSSDSYRYRIDVYDIEPETGQKELKDMAYFFTKQQADKIVITEFISEKDRVLPSEGFSFGLRIEDGLGKPLDFVYPSARLYYQTQSGEDSLGSSEITYNELSQKYFGWMEIPQNFDFSGTAEMRAIVRGPENLNDITSNTMTKKIEVIDTGVLEICYEGQAAQCTEIQELVVKEIEFLQDEIYPGDLVYYEAEITDQDGNPVNLYVTGRVDYQAPWGSSNFSTVGNYDKAKKRFVGEMTVPDQIVPGDYVMKINVHGRQGGILPFSGISETNFTILEKPGQIDTLFDPQYLDDLRKGYRFYHLGEPRIIQGKLVAGHYYSQPLSEHPLSILTYGKDDQGNRVLLGAVELLSDKEGMFRQEITLDDRNYCEYDVVLKSEYNGFEQTEEIDFRMTNTKIFHVSWQEETIPVTVEGSCSVPLEMVFDQPNKKMTIQVDTKDARKFFEIKFPYRLLDGELIVLVNGKNDDSLSSAHKRHDGNLVGIRADSDHTVVEIIGTSAIPEFGSIAAWILSILILSVLAYARLSRFKPEFFMR